MPRHPNHRLSETDKRSGLLQVLVGEGEAIVFPPNYMHETYVDPKSCNTADAIHGCTKRGVEDEHADDATSCDVTAGSTSGLADGRAACTVATSFQFSHPTAALYLRAFLPRMTVSDLQHKERCVSHRWAHLALLSNDATAAAKARPEAHAQEVMARIDADRSGTLTVQELRSFLQTDDRGEWARRPPRSNYPKGLRVTEAQRRQMANEQLEATLQNMFWFQDTDRDGLISLVELTRAVNRWQMSLRRYIRLRKQPRQKTPPPESL